MNNHCNDPARIPFLFTIIYYRKFLITTQNESSKRHNNYFYDTIVYLYGLISH